MIFEEPGEFIVIQDTCRNGTGGQKIFPVSSNL